MADIADRAQELQELHLKTALQARQAESPRSGKCLFCEEPIPTTHRFCDSDCRVEHEAETARQKRIGG